MRKINVAIDATRVRSGGGVAHLIGLLDIDQIERYGIREVHLWAYKALLDKIAEKPWLVKHCPLETEQSLFKQIYWQATKLAQEIQAADCQILFSADATTLCRFHPMVVLSQNMLPYEKGGIAMFGFSLERLRQHFLLVVQKRAFKFANATIFLTHYAADRIQSHTGPLARYTCIAHGVGAEFKQAHALLEWPSNNTRTIRCLYVSPIYEYKHQWVVVRAIEQLRAKGHNISLMLVGGGGHRAKDILEKQIELSDPERKYVTVLEFIPHDQIVDLLAQADIFVFASSCETFGISLLEAMAVGLPIACSNQSSLPETLQDGGAYFDPEDDHSIARAIETLINNPEKRAAFAHRVQSLSENYSWEKCSDETWQFIVQTHQELKEAHI